MRKEILEQLSQLDAEIPLEVELDNLLELSRVLTRLEESSDVFIQEQVKTLRSLLGKRSQEAGRVSIRRKRLSLSPISDPKPQLI